MPATGESVGRGDRAPGFAVGEGVADAAGRVRRRLLIVRWVALADLLLLVGLVAASRLGERELVSVLGPIHGINFLVLLALAVTGALDGLWRWWFPAAILFTAGPPGALLGDWLIERRLPRGGTPPEAASVAEAGAGGGGPARGTGRAGP